MESKTENSIAIDDQLLQEIFAKLGIEPDFYNYKGERHVVSDVVRAQLIRAMGYKIDNDDDARAVIQQIDWEPWLHGIPKVAVLHENWEKAIEIHIPLEKQNMLARWQIRCENGQLLEGDFNPNEQELIAEAVVEGRDLLRYRLRFNVDIPVGYHTLTIRFAKASRLADRNCSLIVAPEKCFEHKALEDKQRLWGFSVQLYSLRSAQNWGIGDFTDLHGLVELAAAEGADFIGLNPLHALFPTNPHHISPYSPSSRLFINYLYLDVTACDGYASCDGIQDWLQSDATQDELRQLHATEYVDYSGVAKLKLFALKQVFAQFQKEDLEKNSAKAKRFKAYIEQHGEPLEKHCVYDALFDMHSQNSKQAQGWSSWDSVFQDPSSRMVKAFAGRYSDEVLFYKYLQWQCHEQLEAAQRQARAAGMRIGLFRDLAVGFDPGGAESWSEQDSYSFAARVGAPPDPMALQGQDWGLPPFNPKSLQRNRYQAFINLIRSNMQSSGALRIDHVMALARLWWLPIGEKAINGAYVHYPLDDLLGILALESHRNRCLVIGEDLGTVPEVVRSKLPESGVYSYKVMYFEKDSESSFKAPEHYNSQAMATVSTHDLATLAGWWQRTDLRTRDAINIFPSVEIREQEYAARNKDRQGLLSALAERGILNDEQVEKLLASEELPFELSSAVHCYLAAGSALLMAIQPEDLLLIKRQINLPGTVDEHPNWQRKLSCDTRMWMSDPKILATLRQISERRSS